MQEFKEAVGGKDTNRLQGKASTKLPDHISLRTEVKINLWRTDNHQ